MPAIPQDRGLDSTLGLIRDGYRFISNRCERYQTDIFAARFLLEPVICFRGEAAAQVFYDTEKFCRQGATPERVKNTLLGKGGVQGLDGAAHRQRKQIFMNLMTPEHMDQLTELTRQYWQQAAENWPHQEQIILYYEANRVLCRAACAWSGVPLPESEVDQHTHAMEAMIDASGGVGPRHWLGQRARQAAEEWIQGVLTQIRSRQLDVPEDSAAYAFAWHRSPEGDLLDLHAAAVDLLNVIRPIVAIGRYITFAALALHQNPECRTRLQDSEGDYPWLFTQEVRRFYPFFPFAAACTRHAFDWQGYHFPAQMRVLLDLYATNLDPELWEQPERFNPERFRQWQENAFDFIPQGGGDYYTNHRCAGEWVTIRLMEMTLDFLANQVEYTVPEQNLEVPFSRMPTIPKSRFVITQARLS